MCTTMYTLCLWVIYGIWENMSGNKLLEGTIPRVIKSMVIIHQVATEHGITGLYAGFRGPGGDLRGFVTRCLGDDICYLVVSRIVYLH